MPLYDYRCTRCDTQFEVRQSFSDDTLQFCPTEGGPATCVAPGEGPVQKVFSGVGISFKGDGFYKNDHGANAKGRRKEREAASTKSSSDSSDSKSSDTKTSSDSKSTNSDSKSSVTNTPSPKDKSKTTAKAGSST